MNWHNPEFLLLAIVALGLWWQWSHSKKSPAIRFPSLKRFRGIKPGWRVWLYRALPTIKLLACILLILALARPQKGNTLSKITTKGISIMMAVDISGSMRALDFSEGNQRKNRLQVVKEVFREFVAGGDGMEGRANDLLGLVAFGGYPESRCPLTLDHDALLDLLAQVEIPKEQYRMVNGRRELLNGEELQTAIGDAVAIAVERLKHANTKSKVLILLTDGENTAGVIDPLHAAAMAPTFGIKIYTIGVGSNGLVRFPVKNLYGETVLSNPVPVRIDEELLKKIAKIGGGTYHNATNRDALTDIYREIDRLERQEIEIKYLEYREWYALFLIPAIFLLFVEKILSLFLLRKVP